VIRQVELRSRLAKAGSCVEQLGAPQEIEEPAKAIIETDEPSRCVCSLTYVLE